MNDLFDLIPPRARTGDPETSHEAAREILPTLGERQRWAAECVRQTPWKTQAELGQLHCPNDPRAVGRRLSECEKLGLVVRGPARRCSVSGRKAETWGPVE